MANLTFAKPTCKWCDKVSDVVSVYKSGGKEYLKLKCGHTQIQQMLSVEGMNGKEIETDFFDSFISYHNENLLPFQKVGAKFAVDANARCLIADEQGLGKTVQALAVMKQMKLLPAVIITKAALIDQWAYQSYNWCSEEFALVRVIRDVKYEKPWPKVCPITVISYDSFIRCKWFGEFKKTGTKQTGGNYYEYILNEENIEKAGIKLLILDETQQIKNRQSKRAIAVNKLAQKVPHVLGLSGTPIKNNAAEYFSILNILQPKRFNNFSHFTYKYVDVVKEGMYGPKYGGFTSYKLQAFHEDTEDFIIRRTQEQVMPELPKTWRQYQYYELGDEVKEAYINKVKEFQKAGKDKVINIITYLNDMRQLTGISKVSATVDYVEEFIDSHPDKKIAVFTHHHLNAELIHKRLCDVIDSINKENEDRIKTGEVKKLSHPVLTLKEESAFEATEKWKLDDNCPVFIGTILACGEGLNMQFCHHAVMVEREWNPANEEQTEKRFSRIGIDKDVQSIIIFYPIALGTIDEFFAELVERKRVWMKAALDNKITNVEDTDIMKDLTNMLMEKGLERWNLGSAGM